MPCTRPRQAVFHLLEEEFTHFDHRGERVTRKAGTKAICFSPSNDLRFFQGLPPKDHPVYFRDSEGEWSLQLPFHGHLTLPCNRCPSCKASRAREWAVRQVHESQMHEDSCFVTLTYNPENICTTRSGCPTLDREAPQLFLKRLRKKYSGQRISYVGCGEYGEHFDRPHYHFNFFGYNPLDLQKLYRVKDYDVFTSESLSEIWGKGFVTVGEFNSSTAVYLSNYLLKKETVKKKHDDHYGDRLPEFSMYSSRPAPGLTWYQEYGESVRNFDNVVIDGFYSKVPRYYDKKFKDLDPDAYFSMKEKRKASIDLTDATYKRLRVKAECFDRKLDRALRTYELNLGVG